MANIDTTPHDPARAAHDALEPGQPLEEKTQDQRAQKMADDMARKSSDRTRKFEEGAGITTGTDGH